MSSKSKYRIKVYKTSQIEWAAGAQRKTRWLGWQPIIGGYHFEQDKKEAITRARRTIEDEKARREEPEYIYV